MIQATKLTGLIRKPAILMPMLSIMIISLWSVAHQGSAAVAFDTVRAEDNLLTNSSLQDHKDGVTTGWRIESSGAHVSHYSNVAGVVDPGALRVEVDNYVNGATNISSPEVAVSTGQGYYFKAFYVTDTKLDVLVHIQSKDGSSKNVFLKHYPDYDYQLSALSASYIAQDSDATISFVLVMSAMGYTELDSAYVRRINVQINPEQSANLLPSDELNFDKHLGVEAIGQRVTDQYMIDFRSSLGVGQAGWQLPHSVQVEQHQLMELQFSYASNQQAEVGLDYIYADGSMKYVVIQELNPLSEMTHITVQFEIPVNAVAVKPSVQLSLVGSMTLSGMEMRMTKPTDSFVSPRISITFDDGWLSSYQNGADVMEKHDFLGTYYINPGVIGDPGFLSLDDLIDLQTRGHQIGSHGENHIDLTSVENTIVEKDLQDSSDYIKKLGIHNVDFASPYGKFDQSVLPSINQTYRSNRGTVTGINTKQNLDTSDLKGLFMRKEVSDEGIIQMLDAAKQSNGWLILIYHQIEPSESPFALDRKTFERHMNLVKASGIKVQTVDEVLGELTSGTEITSAIGQTKPIPDGKHTERTACTFSISATKPAPVTSVRHNPITLPCPSR